MFNAKRLLNTKKDKQSLAVYITSVNRMYDETVQFRKWLTKITYASMNEVEIGTTAMDKLAATIDVYTENKFSLPSTIIGLRKGLRIIGEGMVIFIDSTYKNLDKNSDISENELLMKMMHGFDLLMSGSRVVLHTLEFEKQQIELGVDIIDRYYTKQENPDGKINFVVKFTQPNKITGRIPKEGSNNGSNERH